MKLELGSDISIELSTQEDIDYVEANFRAGDRLEHESLGGERTLLKEFATSWTVRYKDEILGYCGVAFPKGLTVFAPIVFLCYMSCENANRHKLVYVKMSRKVLKEIVRRVPAHVTTFRSLPNVEYKGSVIWHLRVLKMRNLGVVRYLGHDFVLFETTRKELEEK